ncbi:hypothetical protein [Reyranella sp.]|uniref:hypothetical protein n=1 Tax=Reyranella sp. TaxID=1929291 RepID=UPI003D1138AE
MERSKNQSGRKSPIGAGTVVTLTVLLGLLVLAGAFLIVGWETPEGPRGSEMSVGGYIAMALGTLITLAVGGGLMFLMFYSNRHGRD